jgi:glutathione S-transferase
MKLYYDPRSTYSQKTLIALYEKRASFTPVVVDLTDPADRAALTALSPLTKVPVLVLDDGWRIPESSIIIEYVDTHVSTGTRLIPDDADLARQTRFHDRLADLYVNDASKKIAADALEPEAQRDPTVIAAAHQQLDAMFDGLNEHLAQRTWIMGDAFTMADCALIPGLTRCRTLHPFARWKHLTAYAARALERPSVLQVHQEIAPYMARPGAP